MKQEFTLPDFAQAYLTYAKDPFHRRLVRRFHLWLNEHQFNLENLTQSQLNEFLDKPAKIKTSASTRRVYSSKLRHYLRYLHTSGLIVYCHYADKQRTVPSNMPACAIAYLADNKNMSASRCLVFFHRWLETSALDLEQIGFVDIEEFLKKPSSRKASSAVQRTYKRQLLNYLRYLHENGALSFNPEHSPLNSKYLPPAAREFINEISVSLKSGTIRGYEHSLRNFQAFISQHTASVYDLDRTEVVAWLHDLKNKNLHPSTRGDMIGSLRVYLRWRYERELLRRHPDNLVQSGDFPKLPDYLPRPLSPDIDRNLQTFLLSGQRHFLYRRGLWLMRKTGLRIGELESLEFDCLRTDQLGNTFLKVPLGKLNNERLVPVTAQIVQLVTEIQNLKPTTRKYLLGSTVQNKPERNLFYAQLKYASRKFKLPALIQSHQLRHTCATELINSGMSLTSIMSFLGHKDFRMTLRYAKITQHTVAKEFHLATQQAETKYAQADPFPEQSNGLVLLANLIKWCQAQPKNNNPRVTKRLHRLKQEIAKLQKLASRAT